MTATVTVLIGALAILLPGVLATQAPPAAAHSRLETRVPAADTTVDTPPTEVVLTFSESVSARYSQVAVTGPDAASVTSGEVQVDGPTVRQPLAASASASGRYTVSYQVVSRDGHPIGGTYTFNVTRASPASPNPDATSTPSSATPTATTSPSASTSPTAAPISPRAAESQDDGGGSGWVIVLVIVAVVLVAAGVTATVLRRRRSGAR